MKSIEILKKEHENILKIADAIEKECKIIESGKEINKEFLTKAIDFIRNYADRFHHAKEEDILFKEMDKNQRELHCNPIEQMLYEHDLGRGYVKGMEWGVKENNKDKIIENTRGYCRLLREHIYKEDNVLYPLADEALNKKVQDLMLEKFKKIGKDKEKYLRFIKELKGEKRKNEA